MKTRAPIMIETRKLMNIMRCRLVLPLLAALAAGGCEDGLTDINRNPNAPEQVPANYLLAGGIWNTVVSGGSAGSHNTWTMLYHTSLWPQHVAQPVYFSEDRYTPRPGIPDQIWQNAYSSALTDLQEVKRLADEQGLPSLWSIAEIMSVYNFLLLTDLFGDVPYSEALRLDEGIQRPTYDPQAEIYPDLLRRLAEAVGRIDPAGNTSSFAQGDLIYEGDMEGWRRFGNSLRLRVAMRIADTPLGADAQQAFAAAWSAGVIDSNERMAQLAWLGTPPAVNDLFRNVVMGGRTGDFRMSNALVDTLQNRNDPRLPIYAAPSEIGGVYRGLPNGMNPASIQIGGRPSTAGDYSTIGDYFLHPAAPAVLQSYAEVLFLGAEAAARGWIADDAESFYRQAITASMRQYGIAQTAIDEYLAQPNVAYTGQASIHVQKWIALFLAGPEAFNEFRRTGMPNLQLAANASEPDFPQRIPYPPEEALYNPTGFPADVRITTPVWWSLRAR
jgi:hypothetical protein